MLVNTAVTFDLLMYAEFSFCFAIAVFYQIIEVWCLSLIVHGAVGLEAFLYLAAFLYYCKARPLKITPNCGDPILPSLLI